VEEPYTVREARIHVRHVRDLLKSADNGDAYQGNECASLSYLGKDHPAEVDDVPPLSFTDQRLQVPFAKVRHPLMDK
jgi:hypothetical protein